MSISAFFHLTKLFKVANLFNMLRKCSDLTHVPWLGSWDHLVLAKENNMNGYLLLMQFEKLDMSSFIFFSQFPGAFREGRKIINMPGIKVGEK